MNDNNVIKKLIGVKLTVRFHTGRRQHDDLRSGLETQHHIEDKSSTVRVQLIGKEWQKPVTTAASQLREWFYHRTLPWQDGGVRVIPVDQYMTLLDELSAYRKVFEQATGDIIRQYDRVLADAKRRLNGAFRDDLFPLKHDLEGSYGVDLDTLPIPFPDDIRYEGLESSVVENIKAEAWSGVERQLNEGVKDLTGTVAELLADAHDRIQRASNGEKVKLDTLTEKAKKCVTRIRALNVTGDSLLDKAANEIDRTLVQLDAEQIRSDKKAREKLAKDTSSILKTLTNEPEPEPVPEVEDIPVPKAKPKPKPVPVAAGGDVLDCI